MMRNFLNTWFCIASFFLVSSFFLLASCVTGNDTDNSDPGVGGSTARFVIQKGHLITIDSDYLQVFSLENPEQPKIVDEFTVRWGTVLETIYPYQENRLLIGTNDGAFIMDHSTPGELSVVMIANHVTSCDPVIAHGSIMYVTLRNGRECGVDMQTDEGVNQLLVYDISELGVVDSDTQEVGLATLLKTIELDQPWGLGINGDSLFVCVNDGVVELDIATPSDPQIIGDYSAQCNDIIASTDPMILTHNSGIRLMQNSDPGLTELAVIRAGE